MRALVIFDDGIDPRTIGDIPRGLDAAIVFPLTNNFSKLTVLHEVLHSLGVKDVHMADSGRIISSCIEELKDRLAESCARLGALQLHGRSVREWLLLHRLKTSAWWFGLLAERNPLKTDVFLRMAQIRGVDQVLSRDACDLCVVATRDATFTASLRALLTARGVEGVFLGTSGLDSSWLAMRKWLISCGMIWHAAKAGWALARVGLRKAWIWRRLGTAKRYSAREDVLLFVTYYPLLERKAAERGIFRNKFCPFLQDELSGSKQTVQWILIFTPLDGLTFWDSVELARRFIRNGERMLFLEEVLHWSDFVRTVRSWLWVLLTAWRTESACVQELLANFPDVAQALHPLFQELWRRSFWGSRTLIAILQTLAFTRVFGSFPRAAVCLYYAEMHAWEHALNAARRGLCQRLPTIAYLHTSVPQGWFSYYPHPIESARNGKSTDLPLPDIFACSGEALREMLAPCGYPGLRTVEALRYLWLADILDAPPPKRLGRPTLLVVGSIDHRETCGTLALVCATFPCAEGFDVLLKGHPAQPIEPILREMQIDWRRSGYSIHDDLHECLQSAWAALVPSSTVAFEALAFGCEVIAPVFPDAVQMNPVVDFPGYCRLVTCPRELADAWKRICAGERLHTAEECRAFVRRYWCLDRNLSRWKALMHELAHSCEREVEPA